MESKLLNKMFEYDRWIDLIKKDVLKGIDKSELRSLCKPDVRARLYISIRDNKLKFPPAHQADLPKDDGGTRTVYVGETIERVVCSLINDCLFELLPHMIHKSCKSYQKGLSCQKAVKEFSKTWGDNYGRFLVVKTDYHHYFDDISRKKVFEMLDKIEKELGFPKGEEPVINLLRRMYSSDLIFDTENNLISKWSGIRQGNPVASFMADAILYDIDKYMSKKYPYYVRYSDDSIILAENPDEVIDDMTRMISDFDVTLNRKKIDVVYDDYIKFLGFSVNGYNISISEGRMNDFMNEIAKRTIRDYKKSYKSRLNSVNRYLYKGNGEYSFATSILGTINVECDIQELNEFVMCCLNGCRTKGISHLSQIGTIYYQKGKDGVVGRTPGSNMNRINKQWGDKDIEGYLTLGCMRKNLLTDHDVYETLVRQL